MLFHGLELSAPPHMNEHTTCSRLPDHRSVSTPKMKPGVNQ